MVLFKGKLVKMRVAGIVMILLGVGTALLSGMDNDLGWSGNLGLGLFAVGLVASYFGVANENDPSWKSGREKKIEELERRTKELEERKG